MGAFNLRWLCFAVLFVSSLILAAKSFAAVSADYNQGYFSMNHGSVSYPAGYSLSFDGDYQPLLSSSSSDLLQTSSSFFHLPGGYYSRLVGTFIFDKPAVDYAASYFLCTLPITKSLTSGLSSLVDSAGWVLGDDGYLYVEGGIPDPKPVSDKQTLIDKYGVAPYSIVHGAFSYQVMKEDSPSGPETVPFVTVRNGREYMIVDVEEMQFWYLYSGFPTKIDSYYADEYSYLTEYYNAGWPNHFESAGGYTPDNLLDMDLRRLTCPEIQTGVTQFYTPSVDDWPLISRQLKPSSLRLESMPDFTVGPDVQTSVNNQTGMTVVTETVYTFSFVFENNPSELPSIVVNVDTNVKKYENGVLVSDDSVSESDKPPSLPPGSSSGDVGVSGGGSADLPFFCQWAGSLCDWLEWTQESPGAEPSLDGLKHDVVGFERYRNIDLGPAVCPEPMSIHVGLIAKDIEISFEPFCTLADYIRGLVIIAAYLQAAYITLGVARNA